MAEQPAKVNKKKKSAKVPYYSPDEEKALIEAATSLYKTGNPRFRMGWAIPLVLNTGVRVGELAALQWEKHIDFEKKSITVECTQITIKDRRPSAKKKYIIKD